MRIVLERTSHSWLLTWKPYNNRKYPINYENIVFASNKEAVRHKMNQLLKGVIASVEFEADYNPLIRTLKLVA
jgi:hypothetical protein